MLHTKLKRCFLQEFLIQYVVQWLLPKSSHYFIHYWPDVGRPMWTFD